MKPQRIFSATWTRGVIGAALPDWAQVVISIDDSAEKAGAATNMAHANASGWSFISILLFALTKCAGDYRLAPNSD
jgi:hypothetical protein